MFRNFLKVAWRNLMNNKLYIAISVQRMSIVLITFGIVGYQAVKLLLAVRVRDLRAE